MRYFNTFNLIIFSVFACFSFQVLAQNTCKASKQHLLILEKSQLNKNEYLSIISFPNTGEQFYVKENDKKTNLSYKICDIKIESDSLIIEGYVKPYKNVFIEDYYFIVGNKVDTTYYYKWRSSYTNFQTITSGPYDAFFLTNKEYKSIEAIDLQEIPKKLYFYYKLNIYNKSLFIISTANHYTEIFDIKAIQENLEL